MLQPIGNFFKRGIASLLLLTVESLLSLLLFGAAIVIFAYIVNYIFVDNNHTFDTAAFNWIQMHINPQNNKIMQGISFLGNVTFLVSANLMLIAYFLFVRKHRWYSIKVPSIAISSVLMMMLLKQLFQRQRPLMPLLEPAIGLSFPSGHSMSSVTFYGLLIFLIWNTDLKKVYRIAICTLLVLLILAIGISRIYLHVHFATDVIAGFCVGIIWLSISIFILNRMERFSKRNIEPASPPEKNNIN